MSREKAMSLLAHYVGNYTLAAYGEEDKDGQRKELMLKLGGLEQIDEVRKTLELLNRTPWTSQDDINKFKDKYKQINPETELHTEITRLFGGKK